MGSGACSSYIFLKVGFKIVVFGVFLFWLYVFVRRYLVYRSVYFVIVSYNVVIILGRKVSYVGGINVRFLKLFYKGFCFDV